MKSPRRNRLVKTSNPKQSISKISTSNEEKTVAPTFCDESSLEAEAVVPTFCDEISLEAEPHRKQLQNPPVFHPTTQAGHAEAGEGGPRRSSRKRQHKTSCACCSPSKEKKHAKPRKHAKDSSQEYHHKTKPKADRKVSTKNTLQGTSTKVDTNSPTEPQVCKPVRKPEVNLFKRALLNHTLNCTPRLTPARACRTARTPPSEVPSQNPPLPPRPTSIASETPLSHHHRRSPLSAKSIHGLPCLNLEEHEEEAIEMTAIKPKQSKSLAVSFNENTEGSLDNLHDESKTPAQLKKSVRARKTPGSTSSSHGQKQRKCVADKACDNEDDDEHDDTRSSSICRSANSTAKKGQQTKQKVTDATYLTGGAGTIKRKRQLRELVQNMNDGYSDDLFDSSPFKSASKLKVPSLDASSLFASPMAVLRTPGAASPSMRHDWLPGSEKRTPHTTMQLTPGLLRRSVDRPSMDGYINKMVKRQSRTSFPRRATVSPNVLNATADVSAVNEADLSEAFSIPSTLDLQNYADSDDEEDNYYSLEQDNSLLQM